MLNSAAASVSASGDVPLTSCGMLASSAMPLPWEMRSGQNAILILRPFFVICPSIQSVVPGYSVDRKTNSCPSRKYGRENQCNLG